MDRRILALSVLSVLSVLAVIAGCGRPGERAPERSRVPLPLRIVADRGRATTLTVLPPDTARAWIARVSRSTPPRPAPVSPPTGEIAPPVAESAHDSVALDLTPPPVLVVDDGLKPPIPRGAAVLRLPPSRGRAVHVDLDVRVDETGAVSDALWAAGSEDSAAVAASIECALAMRYYPALQSGRPVAVWCRQRFEFGRGTARPVDDPGAAPDTGAAE